MGSEIQPLPTARNCSVARAGTDEHKTELQWDSEYMGQHSMKIGPVPGMVMNEGLHVMAVVCQALGRTLNTPLKVISIISLLQLDNA